MVQMIKWQKYLVISVILVCLNVFLSVNPFWHGLWGGLYLLFFSFILGHWLFIKNSAVCQLNFGLLFLLTIASLIGAASFYFWQINEQTFLFILVILPIILLPSVVKKPPIIQWPNKITYRFSGKLFILLLGYLALIAIIIFLVFSSQTNQSLRSPWEVIPPSIFILYFLATFTLFSFLIFSQSKNSLIIICLHFLASFLTAVIIYQVGFDYDPFIHRANENLLIVSGTLLPKPLYYIGQYSLIIFLYKLLGISWEWLDKLLVPIFSSIFLPASIYYAFKDNLKIKEKFLLLAIFSLLAIPFTNFIATTPQALANLYLLITIFLGIYFLTHPKVSFWPFILLSLMALLIHPLAGIPCVFFVILLYVYHRLAKKWLPVKILQQSIIWEIVILACLALPAAFLINSDILAQLKVSLNGNWLNNLVNLFSHQELDVYYRPYISIHDLIYTYGKNILPYLILLMASGLLYLLKNKKLPNFAVYPLMAGIMVVNYFFLTVGLSFLNLLSYEQQNYPIRVLMLGLYFLLPFAIFALYLFFKKLLEQKRIFVLLTVVLLALALTNSFYLSYPRVDRISEDHGYSTSLTDLKTVNFLEQLNQKQAYVVLASQPVSAAAIKELGFKHYYNNFFFYPVPTGERLYQLFEDLAYQKEKTAEVIATVRYLTGVQTVYFVLNDYWLNAQEIIASHKESADHWYAIDGKNYIFEYIN